MSSQQFATQTCSSIWTTATSQTLPPSIFCSNVSRNALILHHAHTIEFCRTDMAGIVHFSTFYRWMEQAEHAFLRSVGLTVSNHLDDGSTIGFPRVSTSCRFLSAAKFEDTLPLELRVQRIGVKSMTYDVPFSDAEKKKAHRPESR